MHAEELARFHESRMVREHRFEPRDPVAAHTGLAVREPLDARAERRTDLFKHFRGVGHRHTADEINVATHGCYEPAQTSAWIFRSVRTVSSERARAMSHSVAIPNFGA